MNDCCHQPQKIRIPGIGASVCLLFVLASCATGPTGFSARPVWSPDNGDGTYTNPIIFADYSDPDAIRVGDDFYMTASSFNCTPGLPILHSKDLVNWTIIGHAIENLPDPRYMEVQPGCGVWAPAIRYHDGKYWIFFPTPDEGIYMTTAAHAAGPWSDPHLVQAGRGLIDPCPLWDDDGKAYLVHAYANSRAGIKNILRVRPMAPDGSRLLGEGQIVFNDPAKHPTLEGPKFLKKDGWYYILAPAGGVSGGWQVVLRSKNIYGPYEDKIVLEQGSTTINGPHQGALVDLQNGEWWFIHFQDAGVYGRITHLQPVHWKDGWPLMGEDKDGNGIGEPVLRYKKPDVGKVYPQAVPQTSDEFESPGLGLQWQWYANYNDNWFSLTAKRGRLRLFAQPSLVADLAMMPNLLLQKFPARSFVVETRMECSFERVGDEAGLAVIGLESAALVVRRTADGHELILRANGKERNVGMVAANLVKLRVTVADGGKCTFSFDTGAGLTPLSEMFQAREGRWIGAKVGLYCRCASNETSPSYADFDWFRLTPP